MEDLPGDRGIGQRRQGSAVARDPRQDFGDISRWFSALPSSRATSQRWYSDRRTRRLPFGSVMHRGARPLARHS